MLQSLPPYAELHCRSNFSFLTGASHPEELIAHAQDAGYSALAITDECSLAGVVRAHVQALRLSFKLILGAEMRLQAPLPSPDWLLQAHAERDDDDDDEDGLVDDCDNTDDCADDSGNNDDGGEHDAALLSLPPAPMRLLLLVQSQRGYANLSRWITLARRRAAKGQYQAYPGDLEGQVPDMPFLAGLPGCLALLLPEPEQSFATVYAQATWLRRWFGDRATLSMAMLCRPHEPGLMRTLQRVSAATGLAIAATGDVLMHSRSRKPLQDVLTATRLNQPVAACGDALASNAEAHLRSRERIAALYPPDWLASSVALAEQCTFSLSELSYQYPREIVPEGHTATTWLRELTEQGLRERFGDPLPPGVRADVEKELALIEKLAYEPYFLTVADIVRWARGRNILCQGRGSAANSLVCYCLRVTEVDPQRATLLFERFVSAERQEPPDIDVDFEHQRREEVIQYIYKKYGRHRAALTAVVICYRPRSALRDVGRALGLDIDRIAGVSRGQHWFDGREIAPERLRENGLDPNSSVCRHWVELTRELIGFPRHLSQHPGGFLIARDEISQLVPVENATMAERTVIQWDKDDLDTLRLLKVDILALGMLSAIRRALQFISEKTGERFGMDTLSRQADDPAVYDMLCRADSIGTFQVESRAQMSMLPRLQPRSYYDLVVQVAIVRPGPIQGGMVHPYLKQRDLRRLDPAAPLDIPSPELKPALERTLGIPIFQEQVMQIAMIAAEFTAGEADQLRRAMAAWKRKGGLGPFYDRLVGRMRAKGYSEAFAERIFKQIQGFGEYGFPESHAASFALLVYVSAWIKYHHPDAFLAGLLNSQPMGFYAPAQLVRDAREHGVEVRPVDVLRSQWDSGLEALEGRSSALRPVRLGFSRLLGFRQDDAQRLVAARSDGPFAGIEDLTRRAGLDAHALQLLAQGDALAPLVGHRHQAAWGVRGIDTQATALLEATRTHELSAELAAPALDQEVAADYRATHLSLKAHPLALLRPQLAAFKVQPAAVLAFCRPGQLARASGLVTHRQRPETAKGVIFVTLEDDTGAVNVIVWPAVAQAYRQALLGATLMTVYGVWQREGEVRHLIAQRVVDHTALLQGLTSRSRDFH
ncbi:error-prone DNA polymerase [Aquabacterium sp.]|uniref:error-prone DNA polymerase n=1 Tax=Aquabacterium sp. TaxID=1872578 RepID=UPI002B64089F|nr:error-prone DNA polymerase [Aquabacterium sp.]HSW09216.1 error-prone DNA polymerase [Aquabacterium sp.]